MWIVAAITFVVVVGTAGYMLIEDWGFLDALYMTITTITTVGFKEVGALSTEGRVFTIVLILGGVGVILYGLVTIVEYTIKAQLSGLFKRRAVKKQVDKTREPLHHLRVRPGGRVGRESHRRPKG